MKATASRKGKARKAKYPANGTAKIWGPMMAEKAKWLVIPFACISFACILLASLGTLAIRAQQKSSDAADQSQKPLVSPQQEHGFLRWPLPASDQAYASIDGDHLKEYVTQFVEFSTRYRDQGHQFWGRITGTEGDAANRKWLLEKFQQAGLSNVHEQSLDLPPQWLPQSWSVVARSGGKTLNLQTAEPTGGTTGTSFRRSRS